MAVCAETGMTVVEGTVVRVVQNTAGVGHFLLMADGEHYLTNGNSSTWQAVQGMTLPWDVKLYFYHDLISRIVTVSDEDAFGESEEYAAEAAFDRMRDQYIFRNMDN